MRGSWLLAVLGLAVTGCSVLLDWSDYTGGDASASSATVVEAAAPVKDAASEVASMTTIVDAGAPDVGVADDGATSEAQDGASTCNLAACPTAVNITVEYYACCLPDGGCGLQTRFPPGPCMAATP